MANALTGFKIDPNKLVQQILTPAVKKSLGLGSIEIVKDRIRSARDVSDGLATPYSQRGPIYIPITLGLHRSNGNKFTGRNRGVGRGPRGYTLRTGFVYGHNKTTLNHVLTSTSYRGDGESRPGNSMRFRNWASYKRYLGHSGNRDLEVTGRMLGSIGITNIEEFLINLGFEDGPQEKKMRALQKHSEQWGFSPGDEDKIFSLFSGLVARLQLSI